MSRQPFSILALQQEDVPAAAKLSADAFETDRQTEMKGLGKEPFDMEKYGLASIPQSLRHPRCVLLKAVDDATGEVMGYCNWGFRGFAHDEMPSLPGRVVPDDRPAMPDSPIDELDTSETDPIKRLEGFTSRDMQVFMRDTMAEGTRCIYIIGLSVSPKFQGRGAGMALLKWGTDFCDERGVFAWVHSSEPAWGMYAKGGFEVERVLDVDLDEYAPYAPPGEGEGARWGHYVFRYMKYFGKKKE